MILLAEVLQLPARLTEWTVLLGVDGNGAPVTPELVEEYRLSLVAVRQDQQTHLNLGTLYVYPPAGHAGWEVGQTEGEISQESAIARVQICN